MTKIRDRLLRPGNVDVFTGSKWTYSPTTLKCVGSYEELTSVNDGSFMPGIFRVNPCDIGHGVGCLTNGELRYKGPQLGCGTEVTVKGPYMASKAATPKPATWQASKADYVLAKAYAKTKDASAELFVMAGELRETLQLLHNPMKALDRAFRARPGPFTVFDRVADAASGGWLTWLYGVKPLIQDITSIIELAEKKYGELGGLRRKRASVSWDETPVTFVTKNWGVIYFTLDASETTRTKNRMTATVYYNLSFNHSSPWDSRVLGYSWSQLPANLWELVTGSFIVDWVIDVGSWLSNITPDPSVQYLGNSVSLKSTTEHRVVGDQPKFCTTGIPTYFKPSEYTWTYNKLTRRVNLNLPALPVLNTRFLDIKNLVSSIALIWANLPRNWRRR